MFLLVRPTVSEMLSITNWRIAYPEGQLPVFDILRGLFGVFAPPIKVIFGAEESSLYSADDTGTAGAHTVDV